MNIVIESIQKTLLGYVKFEIDLEGLKNAIDNCYLSLGTLYDPIKIDNFVSVTSEDYNGGFSSIRHETKVNISLEGSDTSKDNSLKISDPRLICCKLQIVNKSFINEGNIPDSDKWKEIFKPTEFIYSAPDGTLYISPNGKKCELTSLKPDKDYILSYSILISLKIESEARPLYFILDPLVKVSGSGGRF